MQLAWDSGCQVNPRPKSLYHYLVSRNSSDCASLVVRSRHHNLLSRTMAFLRQLGLVLRAKFIQAKRRACGVCCEICTPVVLVLLLILLYDVIPFEGALAAARDRRFLCHERCSVMVACPRVGHVRRVDRRVQHANLHDGPCVSGRPARVRARGGGAVPGARPGPAHEAPRPEVCAHDRDAAPSHPDRWRITRADLRSRPRAAARRSSSRSWTSRCPACRSRRT